MALLLPLSDAAAAKGLTFLRPSRRPNPQFRRHSIPIHARVKDEETKVINVTDPLKNGGFFDPLDVPILSSAPLKHHETEIDDEKQNYYVNMGFAIRTLREDFPDVFCREMNFDIYRDDIVFRDPLNTFVGMNNYKRIHSVLRFTGRIFFKSLWINIVSVWQPVENVIMIRWIVHGVPRVPWESHGRFDGTSEYKLDKNGKIYEHRVDNIALNSPTKFRVMPVEELIRSLGCPSTPNPTFFETRIPNDMPHNWRFALIRYYLAFWLSLAFKHTAKD